MGDLMGILFNQMKEPIFLKEESDSEEQLTKLKEIRIHLNDEGKRIIDHDIACMEYGILGEKNIAFELKNSHMPMYILHDIYLVKDDLSAQIDYLVFTRKVCFVIECKNLFGNIAIDAEGNFVRTMYFGSHKVQEGIYSPITQNQRHLELMKQMKEDHAKNKFWQFMVSSGFEAMYKSVVVLANPKTVLNERYAKKEVKSQVIRADQLVKYIQNINAASKEDKSSDETLHGWAQSFLSMNSPKTEDYTSKYQPYEQNDPIDISAVKNPEPGDSMICPRCGGTLVRRKGKYGEFYGCSSYPSCRYTLQIKKNVSDK
jgi:hypothetical protein